MFALSKQSICTTLHIIQKHAKLPFGGDLHVHTIDIIFIFFRLTFSFFSYFDLNLTSDIYCKNFTPLKALSYYFLGNKCSAIASRLRLLTTLILFQTSKYKN